MCINSYPRKKICFDSVTFLRTYLDHEGLVNMTRTIKPEEFEEIVFDSYLWGKHFRESSLFISSLFIDLISSQEGYVCEFLSKKENMF